MVSTVTERSAAGWIKTDKVAYAKYQKNVEHFAERDQAEVTSAQDLTLLCHTNGQIKRFLHYPDYFSCIPGLQFP
jgi:hypothetical protein